MRRQRLDCVDHFSEQFTLDLLDMLPRWFLWTMVTLVSWGAWAVLAKKLGDALSPVQSQVLSTIGLLPILAALSFYREPAAPRRRSRGIVLAFGSGVISCVGNIPYYAALGGGAKAATVVPLTSLYPLVTVLLAVVVLKERLNLVQIGGIVCSLAAIYLFNVPGEESYFSAWVLLALASIALWGITGLLQKMATNEISGAASAFWFLVAFAAVAVCMLFYEPLPADISGETWAVVAALGFALAFGNFTILLAFAAGGRASIIMPLTGLYPLVSIPIAIVWFNETMDARETMGVVLALLGVVALSYESRGAALASKPQIPTEPT